jgi:hypothetical protein
MLKDRTPSSVANESRGRASHWPDSALARPEGAVPCNGTVLRIASEYAS